ncbi:MAG: DsbE family thiol:disulfide interchange protein [Gammaproteobacteria bacterium]|nr:DsbE family thiol:disulfide interchange protein [Gammaproteobacteria bacterium]
MRRWGPLWLFAAVAAFLYVGLYLNPKEVPSPLVGRPAPDFTLPVIGQPGETFSPSEVRGKVWLLNIWAPWCSVCLEEHKHLPRLVDGRVPIYGLTWKDLDREAAPLLARNGSPYVAAVDDRDGRIALRYGVTVTPETFVIDRHGMIRMKHVGPVTPAVWTRKFEPLLKALQS